MSRLSRISGLHMQPIILLALFGGREAFLTRKCLLFFRRMVSQESWGTTTPCLCFCPNRSHSSASCTGSIGWEHVVGRLECHYFHYLARLASMYRMVTLPAPGRGLFHSILTCLRMWCRHPYRPYLTNEEPETQGCSVPCPRFIASKPQHQVWLTSCPTCNQYIVPVGLVDIWVWGLLMKVDWFWTHFIKKKIVELLM